MLIHDEPLPIQYRERLAHRILQTPYRALGRPKSSRNEDGATDHIAALVASYEEFWRLIESHAPYDEALKAARELCSTTDTEFAKLIDNKITPVNEIARQRGTFRKSPQKRLSEYSKN